MGETTNDYILLTIVEKLYHRPATEVHDILAGMNLKVNNHNAKTHLTTVRHTTDDKMLKQALRLLGPLFNRYGIDLHYDNYMFRENGELVINDPVTYNDSDSIEYEITELPKPPQPSPEPTPRVVTPPVGELELLKRYATIPTDIHQFKNADVDWDEIERVFNSVFRFRKCLIDYQASLAAG